MHSSRVRLRELSVTLTPVLTTHIHGRRILKFIEKLYECLSERWHDVGWIVHSQATDEANSYQSDLEHLVIKGDEQRLHVLRLCEVFVKPFMQ